MKKRQKKKNLKKALEFARFAIEQTLQHQMCEPPVFRDFELPYPVRKIGLHLVAEKEESDENK